MKCDIETAYKKSIASRTKVLITVSGIVIGAAILLVLVSLGLGSRSNQQKANADSNSQASAPTVSNANITSSTSSREKFMAGLKEFEASTEPQILSKTFNDWDIVSQQKVISLKNEALTLFGSSKYDAASERLHAASQLSKEALENREKKYIQSLEEAKNSFLSNNYNDALQKIAIALKAKPSSSETLDIKKEIDTLPKYNELLNKAKTAHSENNLEAELSALLEARSIAPNKADLNAQIELISTQVNEQRFTKTIQNGLNAIAERNIKIAKTALVAAQELYPVRAETQLLNDKYKKLELEFEIENTIGEGDSASKKDDWKRALSFYKKADSLAPKRESILKKIELSESIISINSQIVSHLNSPHRLSSVNIADDASQLIANGSPLLSHSASLTKNISKLKEEIQFYTSPVPVRIISDGMTSISVRGVGQIGMVKEKIIHLKPGNYVLEGVRSGYKSKLAKINVSPTVSGRQFEISCDEQL
jgi:tetratricopeptide (TPR) repeat protein